MFSKLKFLATSCILTMELLTMDPEALENLLRYLTIPRGLMTLLGWISTYPEDPPYRKMRRRVIYSIIFNI